MRCAAEWRAEVPLSEILMLLFPIKAKIHMEESLHPQDNNQHCYVLVTGANRYDHDISEVTEVDRH